MSTLENKDPMTPDNTHLDVTVHGRAHLVADEGTEKHVLGNDVRPELQALDKNVHGNITLPDQGVDPNTVAPDTLAQMPVGADGAMGSALRRGPGLVDNAELQQMSSEGGSMPALSIGAMMRGMTAQVEKAAATEPVAAAEAAVTPPQEAAEKVTPRVVIELPKSAYAAVLAMRNNEALSFDAASSSRAELFNGAHHGISAQQLAGARVNSI